MDKPAPARISLTPDQWAAFHAAMRAYCAGEAERLLNAEDATENAAGAVWLWLARRPYVGELLELLIAASPVEARRLLVKVVTEV